MPVRMQEAQVCWGFKKQADIATVNGSGAYWAMRKLNASLFTPRLLTENDAEEYGKGNEWASQAFQTSWDVGGTLEKYLSAEMAAWAMCFGLGKVVKTGSTHLTYTCTPLIPSAGDADELPFFSWCEQIRPGASVVLDRVAIGCAIESWNIQVGSGPGRANSKISIEVVGSGKYTEPSSVTMPSQTSEHLLSAAGLTLTINGTDYVTSKNIVSLETGWKNNLRLDSGFYPGSDYQTTGDASTGAIRGRLEFGNRVGTLKFVARFANGSDELTKLKAQTSGTAAIVLTYDTNHSLSLTWQKITYGVAELGETDGIVTVAVECVPMWHSSNGILTAVAECDVDNICQAEA